MHDKPHACTSDSLVEKNLLAARKGLWCDTWQKRAHLVPRTQLRLTDQRSYLMLLEATLTDH